MDRTVHRMGVRERRARLGLRHRLAPEARADGPPQVARSLVAVHSTDPSSVVTLQARFVYDIPMQIFAAMGLYAVLKLIAGFMNLKDPFESRLLKWITGLAVVSVFCLLLGFALAYVGYLY